MFKWGLMCYNLEKIPMYKEVHMNDLAEFFIKKTHKRIKNKIQSSNYTYSQISPYDESIVSKVINFKLTKNNKYLVTNKFIKNLVECNLFNNEVEALWGTKSEREDYMYELFSLLIKASFDSKNYIDKVTLLLSDYVPFAQCLSFYEILIDRLFDYSDKSSSPFFLELGISEDLVFNNYSISKRNAIKFLYAKCKDNFIKMFNNFCNNTKSYRGLEKSLNEILLPDFHSFLSPYFSNDNSLGLRTRNLLKKDLDEYHTAYLLSDDDTIKEKAKLLSSTLDYIYKLDIIQREKNGTD